MYSPMTPLQRLHLDEPSPQFSCQLMNLLDEHGCSDHATNLQGGNSLRLVEHLDNVCLWVTLANSLPTQA